MTNVKEAQYHYQVDSSAQVELKFGTLVIGFEFQSDDKTYQVCMWLVMSLP